MKSLSVLCAAVLACALTCHALEEAAFFKDVPGAPRAAAVSENEVPQHHGGLRIYNGGYASRTQFPYQAALFIDLNTFCGGSLIHEKWVLTAAHCVSGGNIWYVLLGVTESISPVQEGRQTHVTRGGVFHPDYNSKLIQNDLGLIQLMRPATLSSYVKLIALTPRDKTYLGQTGTVSGFGRTDDTNASPVSPRLRFTSLPVVDNKVCANKYGTSTLHPSVLCLRAEGSSSCSGDSGGPLTVEKDDGSLIQIGTVSFGYKYGCTLGWPVGYGNVSMFIDWISATTGQNF